MIRPAFACCLTTHLLAAALLLLSFSSPAQTVTGGVGFGAETRLTSYLQGGYEGQVFVTFPGAPLSAGIGVGGQNVRGRARELLFTSSNYDNLDIRLPWLVSGFVRYHLSPSLEGFYGEVSRSRILRGHRPPSYLTANPSGSTLLPTSRAMFSPCPVLPAPAWKAYLPVEMCRTSISGRPLRRRAREQWRHWRPNATW